MKTFIIACAAAIVIAVIGGVVLNSMQDSAVTPGVHARRYVRLGRAQLSRPAPRRTESRRGRPARSP